MKKKTVLEKLLVKTSVNLRCQTQQQFLSAPVEISIHSSEDEKKQKYTIKEEKSREIDF